MKRLLPVFLSLAAFQPASAALIDDFSVGQGPFTVGPGEEITEEQGVLQTDTVLGGFRIMAPGLDDEAPAGSTVTVGVAGGEFRCEINLTGSFEDTGGGCGTGWDRGDGPLFDLSGSGAFELDITSVGGAAAVAVMVFGPSEQMAAAFIQSPAVGATTLPFNQFVPLSGNAPGWDEIETILITAAPIDGNSGHVALSRFATDGPITGGAHVPSGSGGDEEPDPDNILRDEISGNYFNPSRDGEGVQLTIENDGETFILTYYTYLDGEQVWLIGTGELSDGRILFDNMSITGGADYGSNFDPEDAEFTFWGEIEMAFTSCNRAVLNIAPDLADFEPFLVEMQRILPTECGAGGPSTADRVITGNWFDPERDGEGFQLAYEEGRYILTFYTYKDGEQVWLIGVGDRNGNTLTFSNVNITRGADFAGRFRAGDVESEFFGEIEMVLDDCNNATIKVDASLEGFGDQTLEVEKIVPGSCNG